MRFSDLPQPPAPADELLDVLTPAGEPTGLVKRRADVHRDGDWHRVFHLWVVKEDRYVLFQRRAATKDIEPGKIDATVGGHYGAGEDLRAVLREVEEEIGLNVSPADLHPLINVRIEYFYEHATDREHTESYVLRRDAPLNDYRLPCNEVTVLYEVPIDGAIELYRNGTPVAAAGYDCQGRNNNALLYGPDLIEHARDATVSALEAIREWLADANRSS